MLDWRITSHHPSDTLGTCIRYCSADLYNTYTMYHPPDVRWHVLNDTMSQYYLCHHRIFGLNALEVDRFLKRVAPYFPKASKIEDIGISGYPTSVSELPALQKAKTLKFEEVDTARIAPIPSITSQGRLATLLNDEPQGNSSGKINIKCNKESEDPADPFSSKRTPKEPKENNSNSVRPPPGPPSDSSDSDTDSESRRPPKIPPGSSKRPSVVAEDVELKPKRYHFDLKLKPESVPQWNGNPMSWPDGLVKLTIWLIILRIYKT